MLAAYNMAGWILPSFPAGVQRIISSQPAMTAGTASINTVENRGELPPGTYNPTLVIGTWRWIHFTPGAVITSTSVACALWNASIFFRAVSMASFNSSLTSIEASAISWSLTARESSDAPVKRCSYSFTATSPPLTTLAIISVTMAFTSDALSARARCDNCCHLSADGYLIISIFEWLNHVYKTIFSISRARIPSAPTARSLPMISQKRFSSRTV